MAKEGAAGILEGGVNKFLAQSGGSYQKGEAYYRG